MLCAEAPQLKRTACLLSHVPLSDTAFEQNFGRLSSFRLKGNFYLHRDSFTERRSQFSSLSRRLWASEMALCSTSKIFLLGSQCGIPKRFSTCSKITWPIFRTPSKPLLRTLWPLPHCILNGSPKSYPDTTGRQASNRNSDDGKSPLFPSGHTLPPGLCVLIHRLPWNVQKCCSSPR